MADVRVDFKSDTTSVTSGIAKIKTGLGGLNSLASSVGGALKTGFVAIGAAALAAGTAFAAGSKDIINYGGDLDDLSTQTGIAVNDLVVLQEAFKFAGLGTDAVSKAVLGLNTKLANPSDRMITVLNNLGLSLSDVSKLSMGDKFTTIAQAISNLSSSSEKAAAASTLFGRSLGSGLLPLFANKNALKEAATSVGSLGENMRMYAPSFAKIGDAVDSITTKFRQFFAAALGQNADKLVALADKLLAVDLGNAGTGLGKILSDLLLVMEGKSLRNAIIDGISFMIPVLVNAFIAASEVIAAGIMKAISGDTGSGWENVSISKTLDDLGLAVEIMKAGIESPGGATSIGVGSMLGPFGTPLVVGGTFATGFGERFEIAERIRGDQKRRKAEAEAKKLDAEVLRLENLRKSLENVNEYTVSFLGFTESLLNASREFMLGPKVEGLREFTKTWFDFLSFDVSKVSAKIMKPKAFKELGGQIPLSDLQRVGGAKIFSTGGSNAMLEEQKKANATLIKIYEESKRRNNVPPNLMAVFA
jgi:hypothetical protein